MGPSSTAADRMRVRVIGPFEIEDVDLASIGSKKGRTFLKALAVARGAPVSVDRLAEIIWGDDQPAKPADQLSVLASRARKILGSQRLLRDDAGYRLVTDWLDLDELERLAKQAADRLAASSFAAAGAAAAAALRLVRGELLADEPDAWWLITERESLAATVRHLRCLAAEAELLAGHPVAAAQLADEALTVDPYDEVALRVVMEAHRQAGRPASALAAYARMRERLREELGVSPTPATEELHRQILLEDPAATALEASPRADAGEEDGVLRPRHLAGRAAALELLDAELARVRAGATRFVTVEGEAGIGKSTLLDVWSRGLAATEMTVMWGRSDELARQLPLQAVLDAVSTELAMLEPERAERVLAGHEATLGPLLGRSPAPGSAEARRAVAMLADSGAAQNMLFAALVEVLQRLAERTGAVLFLDDIHFAGESTVHFLRFLRRRAPAGLMVVVATRPEGRPELETDQVIELGPLDFAAAVEVVGEARAAELFERSGGHPLLLVELAHAEGDALPGSVRAAVAARLRQIGRAATTLETAAVLGSPLDLDLIATLTGRSPVEVLDDLEAGLRHRFLDEEGASFVFRHALVREAVAEQVSAARRALLHREAAKALAARSAVDPLAVAHHAELGGELELAARMLGRAASEASRRQDRVEAVRLLDRALARHDSAELRLQRGFEHLALGHYDDAIADADVARATGEVGRALELTGWSAYYLRDFDRALLAAEEGARRALDPLTKASCLLLAGRVLHADGSLVAAEDRLSAAVWLGEPSGLSVAPIWLAALRVHQGRSAEAIELFERAALAPALDQPYAIVHRHLFGAYALALAGLPAKALAELDAADRHIAQSDFAHRYAGRAANWRGWIIRYLGALDEADDHNLSSLEQATSLSLPEPQAHALLDQADGALHRGDLDRAAALLTDVAALDLGRHAMSWRHAFRRRLLDARLALAAGRYDDAIELAASVEADARAARLLRYEVLAGLVRDQALLRSGRSESVDVGGMDDRLARLSSVAGGEAWYWLAMVADAAGSSALRERARTCAAGLAERAGAYRDAFERRAAEVIG